MALAAENKYKIEGMALARGKKAGARVARLAAARGRKGVSEKWVKDGIIGLILQAMWRQIVSIGLMMGCSGTSFCERRWRLKTKNLDGEIETIPNALQSTCFDQA